VSASGGSPAIKIQSGTGRLYWSWIANGTGNDCHGVCLIQATGAKIQADYEV